MTENLKVAVIVGSLRKDSLNRKLANTLVSLAPQSLSFAFIEIGDLPLYNPDLDEAGRPDTWQRFRSELREAHAFLFVTPEYNRSVPASLKNALDVGSRPPGESVWDGKPGAVISGSPSRVGAFGANHHLRQSMVFLNVPMMQQPEGYVGDLSDMWDFDGNVRWHETKDFLTRFMAAFGKWVDRNRD